ncbi:glycosyltransferase family 2 protein [Thermodesulfobacteriota bacterium]
MSHSKSVSRDPLVSVAIPLFQPQRFLDNIIENVDAIAYKNVEIIISDRHCADDTIDFLYGRYGNDPRFRFIKRNDQINWVDHYNTLLRQFAGKYFLWMPHDDIYPGNYISLLVSCLEEHPDAICAFGRMEEVNLASSPLPTIFKPPPIPIEESWSFRMTLKLFYSGQLGIGFRGLFRRDIIVESAFFIPHTFEDVNADVCWMFGLSLKGRFLYVPDCFCKKRRYPSSTSAQWRFGIRSLLSQVIVLRSYMKDSCSSCIEVQIGTLLIFFKSLYFFLKKKTGVFLPQPVEEAIRKFVYRALYWRWF